MFTMTITVVFEIFRIMLHTSVLVFMGILLLNFFFLIVNVKTFDI